MAKYWLAVYRSKTAPSQLERIFLDEHENVRCECGEKSCANLRAFSHTLYGADAPTKETLMEKLKKVRKKQHAARSTKPKTRKTKEEPAAPSPTSDAQPIQEETVPLKDRVREIAQALRHETAAAPVAEPTNITDVLKGLAKIYEVVVSIKQALQAGQKLAKAEAVSGKELAMVGTAVFDIPEGFTAEEWEAKMKRMYDAAHRLDDITQGEWECGDLKCWKCPYGLDQQQECRKYYFPRWNAVKRHLRGELK